MNNPPYDGWIEENGWIRWGTSDEPIKEDSWRIKDGNVYWGKSGKPMRGANPATFRVFNQIWARDAKRVFVYDSLIRGADSESFEVYNELFARDKNCAYYSFGVIKNADCATFRALDNGIRKTRYRWKSFSGFAADKNAVYHYTLTIGKPSILKGADPSSFQSLGCDYGMDSERVFFQHTRVPKARPSTFRLIGLHYATDGHHIFYGNRIVDGADVTSFMEDPDDDINGRDAFRRYQTGKPIVEQAAP
jgi:hypothetical protein